MKRTLAAVLLSLVALTARAQDTSCPKAGCSSSGSGSVAVGDITGLGSGVAAWLATATSANLAAAVSDETGTGALVFNINPVLENGTTAAGAIFFREDQDNGTNTVKLIGPASTADQILTLPSATDTLVGKATTDTLTNKTLTTPVIDNGSTSAGYTRVMEDSDNGSNYIQFSGVDSLAANRTYSWQDVGGDAEAYPSTGGASFVRVWDDYVCGLTGGGATNVGSCLGMTGQATGSGAMSQNTGSIDANHIGIAQASTAGQAAGGGQVVATAAAGVFTLTGNERVTGLFKLSALSTNADAYTVRFGLLDVASSAPTEGCFFSYINIGSTPNWMMNAQKTSGGAGLTSVDSTVAVTTNWTKLRVSYDGSQCHFFIDGTEAPNSPIANTNVPTAATSWGWGIVAGGGDGTTGTVTLRTDYLEFMKTGLSR